MSNRHLSYTTSEPRDARLEVIQGCMFAGKTTELLRRIRRYRSLGWSVLVLANSKDTRYEAVSDVVSHDGDTVAARASELLEGVDRFKEYQVCSVVAIDEGQFFSDLCPGVSRMLDDNKHVIVACLSGDFRQRPFKEVPELVALADDVCTLYAFCKDCGDGTRAAFTMRKGTETETEIVGGAELYRAVCRRHLLSSSSGVPAED